MMAQDKDKPGEGTKRGAAAGGEAALPPSSGGKDQGGETVTADTTIVAEREIPAPKGDAERPFRGTGNPAGEIEGGARERILDTVRSGRDKLAGEAAGKTRDFVGQGLERTGEALSNIGRLVGDTAPGLEERLGPEYADYARRAADAIDSTAQKLRSKDPDELIDDTRNFVRKSPGVALAGAAIVGFALARLVKSGLDSGRDRDEDDRGGGRRG